MRTVDFSQNHLLSSLSAADKDLLDDKLQLMAMPLRTPLEAAHSEVEHCFFMTEGFASVVANGRQGISIEVGLIGNEGVTGSAVIMGAGRSANSTLIQFAGTALRIQSGALRFAMEQSKSLSLALTGYTHVLMTQGSQSALVNGKAHIDQRLARWLLMAHDRIGSGHFRITHEFLALMLGVRRPGVTTALHNLEGKRLLKSYRNEVMLMDRAGLLVLADWCYGVPEREYERLFGSIPPHAAFLDPASFMNDR